MKLGPINYDISWARLVSDILSPPMVWGALALPITFHYAPTHHDALMWSAIYIALVCLVPFLYIAFMVQRGHITDMHMKVREQRIRPFIVTISCAALAWIIFSLLGAPLMVPMLALFTLIQLTLIALISLVWQISVHAISISGATVAAGALFGPAPAAMTVPLVLLVGAARLKLRRHTPAQVVAGTLVGVITPLVLFIFLAV